MEISKSITKRVRGLHRAIKMHKCDGHYYGANWAVLGAITYAELGDFKNAREALRTARSIAAGKQPMNVNEAFGKMGRKPEYEAAQEHMAELNTHKPELIKCELSKKFLAAVKAPAIPTEHMWMHDQLENMFYEAQEQKKEASVSKVDYLNAGIEKIRKAVVL